MLEVNYVLAQQGYERLAQACLETLRPRSVKLPWEPIPNVTRFRRARLGATGRRISYVDAIGPRFARENGYAFPTEAREFKGLPEVCFDR